MEEDSFGAKYLKHGTEEGGTKYLKHGGVLAQSTLNMEQKRTVWA